MERVVKLILSVFFALLGVGCVADGITHPPVLQDLGREMQSIDALIAQTQKNLYEQMKLKELLKDYYRYREEFTQGLQSKHQAAALVSIASDILKILQSEHLQHLCTPTFVDEITFFSSIAGKKSITRYEADLK